MSQQSSQKQQQQKNKRTRTRQEEEKSKECAEIILSTSLIESLETISEEYPSVDHLTSITLNNIQPAADHCSVCYSAINYENVMVNTFIRANRAA